MSDTQTFRKMSEDGAAMKKQMKALVKKDHKSKTARSLALEKDAARRAKQMEKINKGSDKTKDKRLTFIREQVKKRLLALRTAAAQAKREQNVLMESMDKTASEVSILQNVKDTELYIIEIDRIRVGRHIYRERDRIQTRSIVHRGFRIEILGFHIGAARIHCTSIT